MLLIFNIYLQTIWALTVLCDSANEAEMCGPTEVQLERIVGPY